MATKLDEQANAACLTTKAPQVTRGKTNPAVGQKPDKNHNGVEKKTKGLFDDMIKDLDKMETHEFNNKMVKTFEAIFSQDDERKEKDIVKWIEGDEIDM